jgi:hypothetical protein
MMPVMPITPYRTFFSDYRFFYYSIAVIKTWRLVLRTSHLSISFSLHYLQLIPPIHSRTMLQFSFNFFQIFWKSILELIHTKSAKTITLTDSLWTFTRHFYPDHTTLTYTTYRSILRTLQKLFKSLTKFAFHYNISSY